MGTNGARTVTVTAAQTAAGARLLGGPLRLCGWSLTSGQAATAEATPANPPAAQLDTTVFTVPAGAQVLLDAVSFTFTTDATVGNRVIRIEIRDGAGNVVARIPGNTSIAASTTAVISAFLASAGTGAASGSTTTALPNLPMQPAWTVHIVESGTVGAADQISGIVVLTTQLAGAAAATFRDGGQQVAFSSIIAGGTDTQGLPHRGIAINTDLSVLATLGAVSGVLWYYLAADIDEAEASY